MTSLMLRLTFYLNAASDIQNDCYTTVMEVSSSLQAVIVKVYSYPILTYLYKPLKNTQLKEFPSNIYTPVLTDINTICS